MNPVGAQANMRDTTPIHQFDFGGSTAQENVRESECVDLVEKHGFSVHEKTLTASNRYISIRFHGQIVQTYFLTQLVACSNAAMYQSRSRFYM